MNKAFALSLLAAASGACMAQIAPPNSIQLYGIVDVGVQRVTGYAKGTDTALVSGIMEGSRFGLRGNEDLGGGWRALFTLENRTEANNGSISNRPPSGSQVPDRLLDARLVIPALCPVATPSGPTGLPTCAIQAAVSGVAANIGSTLGVNHLADSRFWDRQAYVGLVTPYGAILAGRQYTPAYEISATFDIMGTQSSLAAGQAGAIPPSIDIRVSNALQYRIVMGGLTASAMYAFGGVPGNNSASRFGGVMASYKLGDMVVGAAYNRKNNDLGEDSLTSTVLGASYAIGPGTVSGMVVKYKDDNFLGGARGQFATALTPSLGLGGATLVVNGFVNALKQDAQLLHVGYKMTTGPNTFYVAYTTVNDKRPNNADTATYGVAYTYALSKRTDLNAVVTHFNNKNLAQAAPGQAGFLGGVTKSAGTDSNSLAFGIRHRF
ncbi:MAG: porin [Burkholderiaceae bacterium]|nr:porin [Burkholderiaceae bacterium]